MEEFVKLKDITKVYHMGEVEIRAADNINFSIKKGEFVVIVGPSGAGKTTVLNILGAKSFSFAAADTKKIRLPRQAER